jgi:hemerythrin-like domain-containing protein
MPCRCPTGGAHEEDLMTDPSPGGASTVDTRDVVDLILADHDEFERLFRALRNREEDRAARLRELADLLVAHAEAEEREVYPTLMVKAPEEGDEIEHGWEEHAEGHEALLALLEVDDVDSEEFEERLEELVELTNHHLDEEERDILNAAREQVEDSVRAELGTAFLRVRGEWLERNPGDVDTVGGIVERARERGHL